MLSLKSAVMVMAMLILMNFDGVFSSSFAQSNEVVGIRLGGTSLCNVEILGVPVNSVRFYGSKTDLINLLDGALTGTTEVKCAGPCPCALSPTGECLFDRAVKEAVSGKGAPPPPPPETVIAIIDDENKRRAAAVGSRENPGAVLLNLYQKVKGKPECSSELCADSKGDVSVASKCGSVKLKVSSSGNVSMSVASGRLTLTLP
jgi:hypothetical protein